MVKSETVYQHYSYEPVGDVLNERLQQVQEDGGTIISVTPTKLNDNGYRCSNDAFILVYDDGGQSND